MKTALVHSQVAQGAMATPPVTAIVGSHFHRADLADARALGQRFALAIQLCVLGAWHASGESGAHYREDDRVIVYSAAATESEARAEYDEWGTIVEVASLDGVTVPSRVSPRASDALCDSCFFPAHEVGPLADYIVANRVHVTYCAGCAAEHQRAQHAISAIREFTRRGV